MRKRAARLAHVQNTTSQYNLPEIGKNIAYKANRDGGTERFPAPAVRKNIAVDLALLDSYAPLLTDRALYLVKTARQYDAHPLYRLQRVPGIGKIFSRVLLYDIHDMARVPRGQDVASYCRRVQCAKASAGKRSGPSGKQIGQASRTGACAEAAGLFLRNTTTGQKFLARLEHKHGKGKAVTVRAPKLARAVSCMLQRDTVFDRDTCLNGEESRGGEPDA
jgi:transposase